MKSLLKLTGCFLAIAAGLYFCGYAFAGEHKYDGLQKDLAELIRGKDARIGVAVIIDRCDTLQVNGNESFPMLSVYKLPIALALGDYVRTGAVMVPDTITITGNDLKPDTYSPMREKYGDIDSLKISLDEVLAYSLQLSDNNASDILLGLLPDVDYVNNYLQKEGITGVRVNSSEAEMHQDNDLCYENSATPLGMATLIDRFDSKNDENFSKKIKWLLETCRTGTGRLPRPLIPAKGVIGHKTGTGFTLPDGRLMAVNDAGYVHLPDGHRYSIAVFVADSGYDMATTESIIAEISDLVLSHVASPLPSPKP